ncbi:UDP-N-acetylmuramoyl-tripeptide--D-alanyl-D-alanine ligase [Carboxydothermus hydrogenoformans]|uniref:UDP-N-acetylmuramoyl-tripeptide--D-alanyl-D-alanine ligase n=1 Tax=Carboxydothermus hydrogenoformans (strain ATCC BAA-161 / DSM 6008 / Z-2901) TaxID=246194 RepID=Q3AAE2_CARHZ|nr:UDP-N-acetylmuramoyl-tripeptide--D-alanyl-D-alanine ligase [Carboxydothermus hydrogenoformans]ABB13856.1 UDP-N-acetylmuramoyl-tripeptide--D-alanyl-D-alanine ligase [Carboxydothermus hydrogenoformans Z-2901]
MRKILASTIARVTGGVLLGEDREFTEVSTDTRTLKPYALFVALHGEKLDGHEFVPDAVAKGAAGVVVERPFSINVTQIVVKDTFRALQELALYNRQKEGLKVIGITGSNGKTTTKDLVKAVLRQKYNVCATEKNFNNELGVPLTLLNFDENTEVGIVEMGMRGLGEIDALCQVARPDIGIITNIGEAHLELLKSQENIARAKSELIKNLPGDGVAIINGESPYIKEIVANIPVKKYFFGHRAGDLYIKKFSQEDDGLRFITAGILEEEFFLPLFGVHNAVNALAAILTALTLGVRVPLIKKGLSEVELTGMRLEIQFIGSMKIIKDYYNASPTSMEAALKVLAGTGQKGRKIAVLGEMYELGDFETTGHRRVGEVASKLGVDFLITVGPKAREIGNGALAGGMSPQNIFHFATKEEAGSFLLNFLKPEDTVLLKASRGMKFEELFATIERGWFSNGNH